MDSEETQYEVQTPATVQKQSNPLIIPGAILIGFALIAAAIYFSGGINPTANVAGTQPTRNEVAAPAGGGEVRPVDENDHIRGNPNAPIVIIEYSDYDCPFCKSHHETMNQVMTDYGAGGQVAWVYRHFPIEQLHPNAPLLALASECVADLTDNEGFWAFSDLIFGERARNELTNITKLDSFAEQVGADTVAFNTCLEEGTFIDKVEEDFVDAANAGAEGTPYSLVLVGGQQGVINGAQPYEAVKQIIDTLLTQIEGS